jgi:tripartite-type tricarboxylate transporter receptor subunit TctC
LHRFDATPMKKKLLIIVAALAVTAVGYQPAHSLPERAMTIVVPASPGGVTDYVARLLATHLGQLLGENVIVENRIGGGTLIGANYVAKAAPDGRTLMVMPLGTVFNSIISKTIPIDFEHGALVPVSVVADDPLVLVVSPHLPVKNIGELIAYAKKKPGVLSFGTVGPGSLPDVAVQLLMKMTGAKMVGIPYGGNTPALTDLLADRIDLLFLPLGSALPYITAGKVKPIGVSGLARDPAASDIPSISEVLAGYNLTTWQALMITGGTPEPVIDKLNGLVHQITAMPDVIAEFRRLYLVQRPPVSAAADKAFVLSEFRKWRTIFREIGLASLS